MIVRPEVLKEEMARTKPVTHYADGTPIQFLTIEEQLLEAELFDLEKAEEPTLVTV
jgi:hypothetical protein